MSVGSTGGSKELTSAVLEPLEVLLESTGPAFDLPPELTALYGGPLGFPRPRLVANFVASVDGVTAVPSVPESSHLIALGSRHDRFVMGLLRACADVVLIGSGTLRGSPRGLWTAEQAFPPAAPWYAELRRRLGLPPRPALAVLSGSGRIDPGHPGLAGDTLVLTSRRGAAALRGHLPGGAAVRSLGEDAALDPRAVVDALRRDGHELILCEGGPTVLADLLGVGLVDELFLTRSPVLAGRPDGEQRLSLLEGGPPQEAVGATLLSLRRAGSHLFLRYALSRAA